MRAGEAIRLDRGDVFLAEGTITVRHSKFDKSSLLLLHTTTTTTTTVAPFLSGWPETPAAEPVNR